VAAEAPQNPTKLANKRKAFRWTVALSLVGALVVVAMCSFGAYTMFVDGQQTPNAAESTGPQKRDISSQAVDPAPLTEAELFPESTITPVPDEGAYEVLKTQAAEDCKTAATDELGTLLADQGCTQIVRATLKHPTGNYVVTAGLFNLKDQASAQAARDGIKPIIDAQKGRFNGLAASGADAIARASTQLGWNVAGHFLAYCVIARTDGQAFEDDDGYPSQIIFDLVETYLAKDVVGNRENPDAAIPGDPQASTDGSAEPNTEAS
jgi:hypothetical protein